MCNGVINVPYVAVKNNEYKAILKIVVNVLNSLQVPAQVYWAIKVFSQLRNIEHVFF